MNKLNKIYQAASVIFTDEEFMNRIMNISNQEEQAKVLTLGEIIVEAMNSSSSSQTIDAENSEDLSEDFNRDPKIPYEYCENAQQYGY